jgi:hypothetical protein
MSSLSVWVHQASWNRCLTAFGIDPVTFSLLVQHSTNWTTRSRQNRLNLFQYLKFVRSRQPGISTMFSLATLVYVNEYKVQSNCNHDPTFRHSSLVSSSGVISSCNVASYIPNWWHHLPTRCMYSSGKYCRYRHPYSKHDYSYVYATLLGNVFGHSDCLNTCKFSGMK